MHIYLITAVLIFGNPTIIITDTFSDMKSCQLQNAFNHRFYPDEGSMCVSDKELKDLYTTLKDKTHV